MQPSTEALITAARIAARTTELGAQISADNAGRELLLLPVLKGAIPFAADLMRRIRLPLKVEYITAKSYHETESTGSVALTRWPATPLKGKHVLIVEDIVDTGRTAAALHERLLAEGPASLALCTLLDKPARRVRPFTPDYTGFEIEDHFVVGYGLDYEEHFRELDAIHRLEGL